MPFGVPGPEKESHAPWFASRCIVTQQTEGPLQPFKKHKVSHRRDLHTPCPKRRPPPSLSSNVSTRLCKRIPLPLPTGRLCSPSSTARCVHVCVRESPKNLVTISSTLSCASPSHPLPPLDHEACRIFTCARMPGRPCVPLPFTNRRSRLCGRFLTPSLPASPSAMASGIRCVCCEWNL